MRHLFLDLEDTVITPVLDGWFNTHMINVAKIRKYIADFKPDSVHLFSFAIWNQEELKRFNLGTRPMLEHSLGIKLAGTPTVDEQILPACCAVMGMSHHAVDFQEMSNFWSKHEAFRLYMRHLYKNTHTHNVDTVVALLDDAVINEKFEWPGLRLKGELVNIDELPEAQDLDALLRSSLGNQHYIGHRPELWEEQTKVVIQVPGSSS